MQDAAKPPMHRPEPATRIARPHSGFQEERPGAAAGPHRWKEAVTAFGVFTAVGLLFAASRSLDLLARQETIQLRVPLIEELTGAYSTALLFPFLLYVFRRWPMSRRHAVRRTLLYLGVMALFSVVKTLLMAGSREILFPLSGLGRYSYGLMAYRFPMEMAKDVIFFWIFALAIYQWNHLREARAQVLRTTHLEARLAEAQVHALRLQLQPHFLFNALNTISSVMYDDPRAADALIGRLGELLRIAMREGGAQEVMLDEEMDFLRAYLEIMQARFGSRLEVELQVEEGTGQALVPTLVLQPLAENSVRHAVEQSERAVRIEVHAARAGDRLLLTVRDTGPGMRDEAGAAVRRGIGLSNLVRRLGHLYGDGHRFRLENAPAGGLIAAIDIPFRTVGTPTLLAAARPS